MCASRKNKDPSNTLNTQSDFNRIKQAILDKKTKSVKSALCKYPALLLEKDSQQNTLFHIAAQACRNKKLIVLMMAQLLQLKQFDETMLTTNTSGKTPLHLAVMFNASYVIRTMMKSMGPSANTIARICDQERKIPISHLFERKNVSRCERLRIFHVLKNKSIFSTANKLSEKIKLNIPTHDTRLKRNFEIANKVMNEVREVIQFSFTHPEANKLRNEEYKQIEMKVNALRDKVMSTEFTNFTVLDNYVKKVEASKVGNCGEISRVTLHRLRKNFSDIKTAIVLIINGDHCFNIIDLDPDYKSNDPTTWGKYAVICDVWAGKAYQIKEIENELEAYTRLQVYNHNYNLFIKYNPHVHQLEIIDSPPQPTEIKLKK